MLLAKTMDQIAATAASGLRARMEALDILSNNLANSNTGGFKLDREFYSLYQGAQAQGANGQQGTTMPVIQKGWTDFQQGLISGHAFMLLLHQRDAEGFQNQLDVIRDGVAIGPGEQQPRRLA